MTIAPSPAPVALATVSTGEEFEALARRVGRPRSRDAAAEPVHAARVARGVVGATTATAPSWPCTSPGARPGWSARSRW